MPMPTSGPISLGQVRTELGGGTGSQSLQSGSGDLLTSAVAPHSMSELYGASAFTPSIVVNPTFLSFLGDNEIKDTTVTANIFWEATKINTGAGTTWFSVNPLFDTGNSVITVSVDRNLSGQYREASIEITNGDGEPNILVDITQEVYGTCLSPDTPITMADGSFKELGGLVIGDDVMSYIVPGLKDDESNMHTWESNTIDGGGLVSAKVVKLVHGTYKNYFIINNLMKITFEHHVFIYRDGLYKFIAIVDVKIGDFLWSNDIGNIEITSKEYINEEHEFITLDVEETDVYFAHGMLVHNPEEKPTEI